MVERIWGCKIGGNIPDEIPMGADLPMREAVQRAFKEITGVDAEFTFSGWAETLTEIEREIVSETKPLPPVA